MSAPWYNTLTGGHLWPASADTLRHFTSISPLSGVTALCGVVISTDFEGPVSRTCEVCAEKAQNVRVIPPPLPEPEPAGPPPDPLAVVAALIAELGADDRLAVFQIAQELAAGSIGPEVLA